MLLCAGACLGRFVFEKEYLGRCVDTAACIEKEEPPLIEVENPCQGVHEESLHIMTWNIEWFPKNEEHTVAYVTTIIEQLDLDVLAIQELDDRAVFDEMLESLPGYTGYYESQWFAGLAYIYKTETVDIQNIFEIYTTSPYWSAFPRSPMVLDMYAGNERYVFINNHFKCCGDGRLDMEDPYDEERRRYDGMNLLIAYIDQELTNEKVIILGDLNDNIADPEPHNIFQTPLNNPEHYRFVDMALATSDPTEWSFPSWPSHLDHILVSNEVFPQLEESVVYTLKIDEHLRGGWYEYDSKISDHRPVGMCLHSLIEQ